MEQAAQDNQADIAGMSFEEALKALESVVKKLEGGEVALDESISLYERGEALRRHCQTRLDAAQARIEKIVTGPDGSASGVVPFDAEDVPAPASGSRAKGPEVQGGAGPSDEPGDDDIPF